MKIAFFNKELPSDKPNGVSVQVHRLAESLCDLGHQVVLFSFSPKPAGVKYQHYKLDWSGMNAVYRKFAPGFAFSKQDVSGFDIVHYHGDDYLCRGSTNRVRTFYGSALFEALHSSNVKRFFYQSFFYLLELVSCLRKGTKLAISKSTIRVLPFVKGCIPCCIPLDRYSPGENKTSFPSLLFVGDMSSRKRGRVLLEAFERDILPAVPQCRLFVVGSEPCSGRNVEYRGRLSEEELIGLYRNCHVYCMASSYEGFGVPAIEAMACGCAVVAVNNPGVREVISTGYNGVLCSVNDLGSSLIDLLLNSQYRSELVKNGLSSVARYSSMIVAREYEGVYSTLSTGLQ